MSDIYFDITSGAGEREIVAAQLPGSENWISYQLFIRVARPVTIGVGRLGEFRFAAGDYIYSGSARRGLRARVNRHLRSEKKLRWHIDYLLAAAEVEITRVRISTLNECQLVADSGGAVVVSGFGSSDCRQGCGSHLRLIIPLPFIF